MDLTLSAGDIITLIVMGTAYVCGYVELRYTVKTLKERATTLEADVTELKEERLTVALLQAAVERLEVVGNNLSEEARTTRTTMEQIGKSLVRIETRMEMEKVK